MIVASRVIAYVFLAIGLAILAETVWLGGGQVGFLAGAVFIVLGAIRLPRSQTVKHRCLMPMFHRRG